MHMSCDHLYTSSPTTYVHVWVKEGVWTVQVSNFIFTFSNKGCQTRGQRKVQYFVNMLSALCDSSFELSSTLEQRVQRMHERREKLSLMRYISLHCRSITNTGASQTIEIAISKVLGTKTLQFLKERLAFQLQPTQ